MGMSIVHLYNVYNVENLPKGCFGAANVICLRCLIKTGHFRGVLGTVSVLLLGTSVLLLGISVLLLGSSVNWALQGSVGKFEELGMERFIS